MANYDINIKADDKASSPLKKIEANLTKVGKTTKKTTVALSKMGKKLVKLSSPSVSAGLKGLSSGLKGLGVSALAAGAGMVFLTNKSLNTLDAIGKTATKLGVTTKFLSEYQQVARAAGISIDTFNVGLQRFIRRSGEASIGTGTLVKPFKELGISVKDSNGNIREGSDLFKEYISKLNNVADPLNKSRLAMAAFDSEGLAFINIANMSADALDRVIQNARDAGLSIDEHMVVGAKKAKDALREMFNFGEGMTLQIVSALSPQIEEAAAYMRDTFNEYIKSVGGPTAFAQEIAGRLLMGVATFIDGTAKAIEGITNAFVSGGNIIKNILASVPGLNFEIEGTTGADNLRSELKLITSEYDKAFEKYLRLSESREWNKKEPGMGPFGIMAAIPSQQDIALAYNRMVNFKDNMFELRKDVKNIFDLDDDVDSKYGQKIKETTDSIRDQALAFSELSRQSDYFANSGFKDSMGLLGGDASIPFTIVPDDKKKSTTSTTQNPYAAVVPYVDSAGEAMARSMMQQLQTIEELEDALFDVSHMALEFGVNEEKLTKTLQDQLNTLTGVKDEVVGIDNAWQSIDHLGSDNVMLNGTGMDAALAMAQGIKDQADEVRGLEDALSQASAMAEHFGISEEKLTEKLKEQLESLKGVGDGLAAHFEQIGQSLSKSMADAMARGELTFDSFKGFLLKWAQDVMSRVIQQQLMDPLTNAMTSWISNLAGGITSGLSSVSGGFDWGGAIMGMFGYDGPHANGGTIPGGKFGLVGERGPELISGPANITPMDKVNSGATTVNFNINAIDTSTGTQFILEKKQEITNIIQQAYNRQGKQGIY